MAEDDPRPGEFRPLLGQLLRYYRLQAGLWQSQLAEPAAMDQSSISDIETGKIPRPQDATLRSLAGALAQYLPYTTPEEIYQNLRAAKRGWASEHQQLSPAATAIVYRLMAYPPQTQLRLYRLITAILDELDTALQDGRK